MSEQKNDKGDLKKLTVTRIVKEITSGTGKNGVWTLSQIEVLDAAGQPINVTGSDGNTATFKTFADLTPLLGKLEEYFVKREDHEKYGTSFMLNPKTSAMSLKLEALTLRVTRLEEQLAAGGQGGPPNSTPPVGGGAPPASSPATAEDDIPF